MPIIIILLQIFTLHTFYWKRLWTKYLWKHKHLERVSMLIVNRFLCIKIGNFWLVIVHWFPGKPVRWAGLHVMTNMSLWRKTKQTNKLVFISQLVAFYITVIWFMYHSSLVFFTVQWFSTFLYYSLLVVDL
jgi:hypothetical protein